IKVSDCNGKPLPIIEGELVNSSGQFIQKINLNHFGLGKFEYLPGSKTHKVRFKIAEKSFEEIIPVASPQGIALEVNSYGIKNKTAVKIKTNSSSIEQYAGRPLYMLVHQDDKAALFDIKLKAEDLEQTVVFSNDDLYPGVNTIRILDAGNNQLAERQIFKYPENNLNLELKESYKAKDTITIQGFFNSVNTNISVSVLPDDSIAFDEENDIYGSLLLNPYIVEKSTFSKYYFSGVTPRKLYELDLLLLNQEKNKYDWHDIMGKPPKAEFEFDFGISLKGTLSQTPNKKNLRVNMVSPIYSINEFTSANSKNEFFFNNLILEDSTHINFNLINEKNKLVPLKVYPQLLNGRITFNKRIQIKEACPQNKETIQLNMPQFAIGSITLEDVEIEKTVKKKLKRASLLGNGNLRGFKITEKENHQDLLQFIRMNGFEVINDPTSTSIRIFARTINSINAMRLSPIVYIDGVQVMTLDMLFGMRMTEIDEIYLNPHAIVASIKGNMGVIKIYRKTGLESSPFKNNDMSYIVKNAFAINETFKNIAYTSTADEGFRNYGTIHWIPAIITDQTNNFKFTFPSYGQKKLKFLIEGFSADGKLVSEVRTIDLK
ncbi:MAG TPA: hypothetical protein VFR70_08345, partial [Flavobacterium sp.]|nr:hypothetical protein [Flavobacterium sp.]